MALVAITKAICPEARAGIRKLYVTACPSVSALTFASGGAISAITMESAAVFVPIDFELNTAFFNQEKKRVNGKGAITVTQTIEFAEEGILQTLNEALKALNAECCLHVIVKTNAGKMWYAGISRDGSGNLFLNEDMRTGDGSTVTGADQTADNSTTKETLTAKVRWYAPEYTGLESAIAI